MSYSLTPGSEMRVVLTGSTPADLDAAYAALRKASGWPPTPADEALMAVQYAVNHYPTVDGHGGFVRDFVELAVPALLVMHPKYMAWRTEWWGAGS